MTGYIQIHVSGQGVELDCWQHVVDGNVVAIVDGTGQPASLPDPYFSACVTGELVEALP